MLSISQTKQFLGEELTDTQAEAIRAVTYELAGTLLEAWRSQHFNKVDTPL